MSREQSRFQTDLIDWIRAAEVAATIECAYKRYLRRARKRGRAGTRSRRAGSTFGAIDASLPAAGLAEDFPPAEGP